jgi:N-acetylated-alpha-linked acidic dipeptidase
MANADILPYDYVEYARTMRGYIPAIETAIAGRGWSVSVTALSQAIGGMETAASTWSAARDAALGTAVATNAAEPGRHPAGAGSAGPVGPPAAPSLRAANAALMRVERALTRPEGLRTRPWFRSLVYASDEDNGYADVAFPSVTEAVRSGDSALVAREVADLAAHFDAASAALRDAAVAVRPAARRE